MPNMRRSLALHAAAMKSGSGRRRRCKEEDSRMLPTALIVLHAGAGAACFAAGALCIQLQAPGSWRFRVYAGSLMAMLGFVAAVIGILWADLELTSRLVFSGLFGLGLFMTWRAYRAWARLRRPVSAWLVALIALGGVAGGIYAMNRVKARLSAQQPVDSTGTMGSG
jgi:hypothetical protein